MEAPTVTPADTTTTPSTPALDGAPAGGYPVVDTGQDTCYDDGGAIACPAAGAAFYGQDAQFTGHAPGYTANGDGTVTDDVTGLMWEQSPDTDHDGDIDIDDKFTYDGAVTYCENLSLAGHDDWRLPDIKTLYSLIDFRGTDPRIEGTDTSGLTPFIDTNSFDFAYGDTDNGERLIDAQFASSTLYVSTVMNGQSAMFGVNLADGRIKGYPPNKDFYVLCTRGNETYGQNDLTDNGDGTLTDAATGLMWAQNDSGSGMSWEDALAFVQAQNAADYLGYSDWRLPNAKELQSIVDYTRSPDTTASAALDPLFNATAITNEAGETDYPYYWSSTSHRRYNDTASNAVYVAFGRGLGSMDGTHVIDVHGAGCQRSDPKDGDPSAYPAWGHGPQGDLQRVFNYVRLVRDVSDATPVTYDRSVYLPLTLRSYPSTTNTVPAEEGYTLFAPLNETTTYLIDEAGDAVFTWSSTYRPGNAVYLLENGNLLRTGNTMSGAFNVGGAGGIVEELAPDGTVVWSFEHDTIQGRLHHDVEPLPNGNVLLIAWERKSEAEALAAGRDPALLSDGELWPDVVLEVDPTTDAVVWEWHVWDHLVQDYDQAQKNYGVVADHPALIDLNYYGPGTHPGSADWNHVNAIDYNAALDQILLSVRNFSEIWVIDHDTTTAEAAGPAGDLLYRWGNPAAYDSGDADNQQLFVQHDAQWIPEGSPGAGHILIFNNGQGRADGDYSSVDEIVPPVDADGTYTGTGPAAPTWRYTAPTPGDFFARHISGAQRLPDGDTLICDGPAGDLFTVDATGQVVWEYDHGNAAIFRATRYPADYAGLPDFGS
jgi:hypothetical protein